MKEDKELLAMQQIVKFLEDLDKDAQKRVLVYVFSRIGISENNFYNSNKDAPLQAPTKSVPEEPIQNSIINVTDIRTLKDQMNPATAVEMAVLVAYYLEDLAPQNEKKSEVGTADITTYFKQAGYPLPKAPKMTLVHAKNSGYFESVGPGNFKLNPVGYNLAAHTMGKNERPTTKPRKSAKRKVAKRKPAKKK
jgi:hypothetical protein